MKFNTKTVFAIIAIIAIIILLLFLFGPLWFKHKFAVVEKTIPLLISQSFGWPRWSGKGSGDPGLGSRPRPGAPSPGPGPKPRPGAPGPGRAGPGGPGAMEHIKKIPLTN